MKSKENNRKWSPLYTVVLVANAVYILLFYIIMKQF